MKDPQVGWIAAIIIGGIAGWLAEQFMKSQMGLLMNIILRYHRGRDWQRHFDLLWGQPGGWIGYLIAGFIGAVLLIWIVRMVRGRA